MNVHLSPLKGARALQVALGITLIFFVIELVGGIFTNSLALQTDALHMLNDAFALAFALVAAWFAQQPITQKKTYGYYRAEILAAFLNGILLWGVVAFIFYEAVQRIFIPTQVKSLEMLVIAVLGLVANGLSALVLSGSRDEGLNIKGAFLHVAADTLGSLGAISAGAIMLFTGWYQADPLISLLIGVLVFYGATKLIRESLNVLLEGVPPNIDVDLLQRRLGELKGVNDIHDIHVWCISTNRLCCMSGHVVLEKGTDRKKLMTELIEMVKKEFGIDHITIQLEDEGYPKAPGEH